MGKANVSRQSLLEAIAAFEAQRAATVNDRNLNRAIDIALRALREELAQTVAEPLIERKVGGVLCETKASAENNGALILGIGVNVNLYHSELPEELGNNATSLAILAGGQIDRNRLLAGILNRVESNCSVASVEGPAPIIDMARRCCTTLKRRVRIQCGCDQFEGESVDLDPQGRLILRDSTGVLRSIESGEVIQTRRIT